MEEESIQLIPVKEEGHVDDDDDDIETVIKSEPEESQFETGGLPVECVLRENQPEINSLCPDDDDGYYNDQVEEIQDEEDFDDEDDPIEVKTDIEGECQYCSEPFEDADALREHIRSAHFNEALLCAACQKYFSNRRSLNFHVNKYHKVKRFRCEKCGKLYCTESGLKFHLAETSSKDKKFSCRTCGERFKSEAFLNLHIKECHDSLECPNCKATFAIKFHLDVHVPMCHKNPKYVCPSCSSEYLAEADLYIHMRQMHDPKKYKCRECGVQYDTKPTLERHLAGNSCNVCTKCDNVKFASYEEFSEHRLAIHNLRSFDCDECCIRLSTQSALLAHKKRAHLVKLPFSCPVCDKGCKSESQLFDHMGEQHNLKKWKCDECEIAFARSTRLKSHIQKCHLKLKEDCPDCGQTFLKSTLYGHRRRYHQDTFKFSR